MSDAFIQMVRAECLSGDSVCLGTRQAAQCLRHTQLGWGVPMCRMVTWECSFDVRCDEMKYRLSVFHAHAL